MTTRPKVRRRRAETDGGKGNPASQFIPYDSPELVPLLIDRIGSEWAAWATAADVSPDETKVAVARILGALSATLRAIRKDDTRADATRALVALSKRVGPTPERHMQLDELSNVVERLVKRNLTPSDVATSFLHLVAMDGPLHRDLYAAGIRVRQRGRNAGIIDQDALKKVRKAFERASLDGVIDPVRIVTRGLTALGYRGARSAFDYRVKRSERGSPTKRR